jgi:ribose 1,5-bisphosphokinase PhnN
MDQIDACKDIVKDDMEHMLEDVQHAMDIVQKVASRSLLPHVRDKLRPEYLRVLEVQGPGAILRQRVSIYLARL